MNDFDNWILQQRIKQHVRRSNRIWLAKQFAKWIIAISLIIFFFRAIARI